MDGLLIWAAIIGAVVWAVYVQTKNQRANNEALGVDAGQVHRAGPFNYLGGFPGAEGAVKTAMIVATPSELALERVQNTARGQAEFLVRVPLADVHEVLVETEEEAKRRLTVTRMLTLGVFSLAFPKKTKGSVLVTIDHVDGPLVLEKAKKTKPEVLKDMGPILSLVRQHGRGPRAGQPAAPAGPADVPDELTKLADLRDRGVLTEEEFQAEKGRLLGREGS